MDRNLTNSKSITPGLQSKIDPYFWDIVLESFREKDYANTIRNIISYVDPSIVVRTSNESKTKFEIPHGSANLCIFIHEDSFEVKAPFLDISEAKKIPLMRKVAELNFSPLNLSHIKLENNQLLFYYKCPLELVEPQKIYDVLKEICVFTDSYDDEFINKYNAKWILEPKIKDYPPKVLEEVWETVNLFLSEAIKAVNYYESKRQYGFAWDVIATTLMKIEYYASPQGFVRTEIEKQLSVLNELENISRKSETGKKFLEKLKNYDKEEFLDDVYMSEVFIPYKWRATDESVKTSLKPVFEQAKAEVEAGDYQSATLNITYHFYNIFYNNNISDEIEELFTEALIKSSNQTWEESSKVLYSAIEKLVVGYTEEENKGGFFKKLFRRR